MAREVRARIAVPHTVRSHPLGPGLLLQPVLFPGFLAAMDYVHPNLVWRTPKRKDLTGYSGWDADGQFIGCCFGDTFSSTRKNPWYQGDPDAFLKFNLAALRLGGFTDRVSTTIKQNYGTLRFWKKLGLGADLYHQRRLVRCVDASEKSVVVLDTLLAEARPGYRLWREEAEARAKRLDPAKVIPAPIQECVKFYCTVELST